MVVSPHEHNHTLPLTRMAVGASRLCGEQEVLGAACAKNRPIRRLSLGKSPLFEKIFTRPASSITHDIVLAYGIDGKYLIGKVLFRAPYRSKYFDRCKDVSAVSTLSCVCCANHTVVHRVDAGAPTTRGNVVVARNYNPTAHGQPDAHGSAWDAALNLPPRDQGVHLSMREIQQIVRLWNLPAFMTLDQAAELVQLAPGTIRNQVSEGRYPTSAITGKPLRFVTTLFIREFAQRGRRQ